MEKEKPECRYQDRFVAMSPRQSNTDLQLTVRPVTALAYNVTDMVAAAGRVVGPVAAPLETSQVRANPACS
jgi:hypothetical protein